MSAKTFPNISTNRSFLQPIQRNIFYEKENLKPTQLLQNTKKIKKTSFVQQTKQPLKKVHSNLVFQEDGAFVRFKSATKDVEYQFPCYDDSIMDFSKLTGPTIIEHNIDNDCITDAEQIKSASNQLFKSLEMAVQKPHYRAFNQ